MKEDSPLISIIIVTHNNESDIVECIKSVLNQDHQRFEVIVVDNNSTDRTVNEIQKQFADDRRIKIVQSAENTGYAGGNNIGFSHSSGELVVLLNPDLVVDQNWLSHLLQAYDKHKSNAGIICSNVLLFEKRDTINACGNIVHLTGFVFSRFYMEAESKCFECNDPDNRDSNLETVHRVAAPSGASMMFSRQNLYRIGRQSPFDTERFFMEYSDIDLAIDFLSHDLLCFVAPQSKVFHKFRFKMNPERLSRLEKGRYQLLGHLTKGTIILLLPTLVLAEMLVWSFIISNKRKDISKWEMIKSKIGAYSWINASRRKNSRIKDLKIIQVMSPELVVYDELLDATRQDPSPLENMHSLLNNLFQRSRNWLIISLEKSVQSSHI